MEPDLNKLRTFLAVVDAGGISPAARRLGRTRSAVSQSVSSLERSLGVRLFNRFGRRLVATAEGRALAARVRRNQELLARTLEDIGDAESAVRGTIRLGLFVGASRTHLAPFLRGFLERHERAQVKLLFGSQRELAQRLLDGRLDFGLALERARDPSDKLQSTRLLRQELVLVSGTRRGRGPVAFAQASEWPVVDYYQSSPLIERWFRHHFGRSAPRAHVRVWAASTDLVLELVLEGAGVGVIPRSMAAPLLRDKKLFLLRTAKEELTDDIWLQEPAAAHRSAGLRTFRADLLQAFAA